MKQDKQILKDFKSWKKNVEFMFKDDFYTQLVNTNNDVTLDKWTIEVLLYVILNDVQDFDLSLFDINYTGSKTPIEVLKYLFKIFGLERPFEKYWNFYSKFIAARAVKEISQEDEFKLMNDYWDWVNDLFELNIPEFNEWIIISNKFIYKKQKGFNLK